MVYLVLCKLCKHRFLPRKQPRGSRSQEHLAHPPTLLRSSHASSAQEFCAASVHKIFHGGVSISNSLVSLLKFLVKVLGFDHTSPRLLDIASNVHVGRFLFRGATHEDTYLLLEIHLEAVCFGDRLFIEIADEKVHTGFVEKVCDHLQSIRRETFRPRRGGRPGEMMM